MDCRDNLDLLTHYVISPLSIFFNVLALYIISKKSIKELSSYKVVLLITCVMDLLHTTYYFLIDLHIEIVDNIPLYFFLGRIKYLLDVLPAESRQYVSSVYVFFQNSITNICVPPFIYRYLIICRDMTPTNKKIFLIYFLFLLPVLINVPARIYLCLNYEANLLALLPSNLSVCSGEKYVTGYRAAHIHDNFDMAVHLVSYFLIIGSLACYPIVIVCATQMVLFLRNNKAYVRDPKLQREITWTLAIQASIPFIIAGIPGYTGLFLTASIQQKALIYINTFFRLRMWIPMLNPLITLYFIKPYRNAFLRFLRGQNYVRDVEGNA